MSERIAIVGSREWPSWIISVIEARVRMLVRNLPHDATVISGGARGVDSWAVAEAKRIGLPFVEHRPAKYVRSMSYARACFARNSDIVTDATRVVAFPAPEPINNPLNSARGTWDTISKAHGRGMRLKVKCPYCCGNIPSWCFDKPAPGGRSQIPYHQSFCGPPCFQAWAARAKAALVG